MCFHAVLRANDDVDEMAWDILTGGNWIDLTCCVKTTLRPGWTVLVVDFHLLGWPNLSQFVGYRDLLVAGATSFEMDASGMVIRITMRCTRSPACAWF